MELDAGFSFKVLGKVDFFVEFVVSVGEGALVLELTLAEEFPVSAHLCLVFDLVGPNELLSLLIRIKLSLRFLQSSLQVLFLRIRARELSRTLNTGLRRRVFVRRSFSILLKRVLSWLFVL